MPRSRTYRHELPHREVFASTPENWVTPHRDEHLRWVADECKIKSKRRLFYNHAFRLALDYQRDKIIEDDLLHVTKVSEAFRRAANSGTRFLRDLQRVFSNRPSFSLWNEPYFMCDGHLRKIALAFKRDELAEQVAYFVELTLLALSKLPSPPPSRKKMLALRKWAAGHLDFWTKELRRPIRVINDQRDGYSEYHDYLRMLLSEIDPESVGRLGTIVREQKAEQRMESASD
jgi:hypothetical protein